MGILQRHCVAPSNNPSMGAECFVQNCHCGQASAHENRGESIQRINQSYHTLNCAPTVIFLTVPLGPPLCHIKTKSYEFTGQGIMKSGYDQNRNKYHAITLVYEVQHDLCSHSITDTDTVYDICKQILILHKGLNVCKNGR